MFVGRAVRVDVDVGEAGLVGGLQPDSSITIDTTPNMYWISILWFIACLPDTNKILPVQPAIKSHNLSVVSNFRP